jgi:competence protein ComEA
MTAAQGEGSSGRTPVHPWVHALPAVLLVLAALWAAGRGGSSSEPVRCWPVPVDVNSAGKAELSLLPGVGPSLAAAIVADRERSGPFRSTDELDRVRGIGPAALARLRPHVAARDPAGDTAAAPAYAAP